jgi:hypothetical protein
MVGQQEDNVGLDMVLSSLPNQANHLQTSLVDENVITIPLKGTTSSSISVCMNTSDLVNKEKNIPKFLQTLHKQAKIWASCNRKYTPWAFIILSNGNLPNCEQVQQLRCSICFTHVGPRVFDWEKNKREIRHYYIQHRLWDRCYEKTC